MKKLSEQFNVISDALDLRDRYYEPRLSPIPCQMPPPQDLTILNQGQDGACTGFGLAAVINRLYQQQNQNVLVSPWMIYNMARRYDEWPGETYEGSSCRGAIKGWLNTGVCLDSLYKKEDGDTPNFEQLEDAKSRTIGAYYRIRPDITEMHYALQETYIIYVSAMIHDGWFKLRRNPNGEYVIPANKQQIGGHAFAIVGYNTEGFWVQNSWGRDWGDNGKALWPYEDWLNSVLDAWVVQIALPTPQIFDQLRRAGTRSTANLAASATPSRNEIWRHFVHLNDGNFRDGGKYWSNESHIAAIADNLHREKTNFDHLLFYAHGGLNTAKDSARRIAAMKNVFIENRIYPFHFMWDTGLLEIMKSILTDKSARAERIAGGIRDWFDRRIENMTRFPGRAIWDEMKQNAAKPFESQDSHGSRTLKHILNTLNEIGNKQVHVAGHSAGAILQAHLLKRLFRGNMFNKVSSCSLLAPAANYDLYQHIYKPLIKNQKLESTTIYNLSAEEEEDDNVARVYGKSLLYLVSNAFEEKRGEALMGMQIYNDQIPMNEVKIHYSPSNATKSKTHGGFDEDPATMNSLLRKVLGKKPPRPFTTGDLEY
ncbi:C1 family peptidase [Microbulbifer sp. SSSA007]|uniref:C1 family peptidase n=1 Tax=Microbulbifer sp. SSSA007 TaxID=3243379 RepID=UPI0040399826